MGVGQLKIVLDHITHENDATLGHELTRGHLKVFNLFLEPRLSLGHSDHLGASQSVGVVGITSESGLFAFEAGCHCRETFSEEPQAVQLRDRWSVSAP